GLVGGVGIAVAAALPDEQPLVALAPVILIVAVVVIACLRNSNLEEVRVAEQRCGRGKASARVTPDTNAIYVNERISRGKFLHARNLIGESVVSHVAVVGIVE